MKDINTILYASDLINHDGREVFATAVREAILHKARLVFLNVIEPVDESTRFYLQSYLSDEQMEKIRDDRAESVRAEIESRIRAFCHEELLDQQGMQAEDVEALVLIGNPERKIIEAARQVNADLLVIGTRVHSALGEIIHHSVAHYVTTHTPCTVMICHIR
ncbi:MAG: universal stress protein [Oceanobacter sp.]